MDKSNWIFLGLGVVLGISVLFFLVFRLGRSLIKRLDLADRGPWDRPLAQPIPKDTVIATYKRRKRYHRHHRHQYQRCRPRPK
jgi:HAMP domain-containing protein